MEDQCKIKKNCKECTNFQKRFWNEVTIAKENWLIQRLLEPENLNKLGDNSHLHEKVRDIAGKYNAKPMSLI